jgi:hypothetical protein
MASSAAGMSSTREAGRVLSGWGVRCVSDMALAVACLIGLEVIERCGAA